MDALFEAQRLSCLRGERLLFENLSFTLASGRALLVSGANGSGKTSLLKILCGLRMPDCGTVLWQQQPIAKQIDAFKRDTLYIGHQNGIKLRLSPLENLRFAAQIAGEPCHDDLNALEAIGLSGFEDEPAYTLSAGQRRRIALARLLTSDARLWILDELFTSIDRDTIARLTEIIARHLQQGGLAILSSHHALELDAARLQRLELTA